MKPFNERLRELRERSGLTQESLARAAGLSVSSISKLEQRGIDPSWSTVVSLAKALNVQVQDFACEDTPATEAKPRKPSKRPRKEK